MNRVFDENGKELSPIDIVQRMRLVSKIPVLEVEEFVRERTQGSGHCNCNGDGVFVLLPENDPDVLGGGKCYMQCIKCGGWSHL